MIKDNSYECPAVSWGSDIRMLQLIEGIVSNVVKSVVPENADHNQLLSKPASSRKPQPRPISSPIRRAI